METYLKCLLRCVPRVELTDRHLNNILFLHKIHGKLGGLYSKLYLKCFNLHKDEQKDMYKMARLFIAYDGALEGGRDQDWWFKQCVDRMGESTTYWSGETPFRVKYEMSKDDPQRYPLTFVYFKHRMLYFTVRSFIIKNKYWLAGLTLAYLL